MSRRPRLSLSFTIGALVLQLSLAIAIGIRLIDAARSVGVVREELGAAGLTTLEAAIRWTQYHSAVDGALGDAALIGVSRLEQLQPIMAASNDGPLPISVVEAFEQANAYVKMRSEYYLQYPYPKEGSPWRSRL